MSLIIDAIILALIALFTFIGYKQGLIKSALKILTFFIAIIISMVIYKPLASIIIKNTTIDESIKNVIVGEILQEEMSQEEIRDKKFLIHSSIIDTANKTIEEIGQNFAVKIIEICTFLILFIVTRVILMFISILSTLITKLPIIKQIDKTGGTIYGVLKGLFIVWSILAIISLISPLLKPEFLQIIEDSIICMLLYKYNLLLIFLF